MAAGAVAKWRGYSGGVPPGSSHLGSTPSHVPKCYELFRNPAQTGRVPAPYHLLIAAAVLLAGCHPAATPFVAVAAAGAASVAVLGRTPVDAVYSLAAGRDCSIVHLEKGDPYCTRTAPPPKPPEFCTRTLGTPDCFTDPAFLPDHPAQIADGPTRLTPAQEKNRTAGWP